MIAVVGEALIDLVGSVDGSYRALPGGAPTNVAVGLARLGVPVALVTRVGRDAFGRQLRRHLADSGVRTTGVVDADAPTTLAVASLDEAGRATYDFYLDGTAGLSWRPGELPDPLPADVTALVTGSLALAVAPGSAEVERLLRREHARGRVTVVLDPNIRPALGYPRDRERDRVERQLGYAHVVKASDEDVAWLYPDAPLAEVAARWLGRGPRLVVVTRGADGAYARTSSVETRRAPPAPGRVVDTVGAGDAFCAGLVEALGARGLLGTAYEALAALDSARVDELLDAALLVATLTCQRAGADPPTAAEVAAARAALPGWGEQSGPGDA